VKPVHFSHWGHSPRKRPDVRHLPTCVRLFHRYCLLQAQLSSKFLLPCLFLLASQKCFFLSMYSLHRWHIPCAHHSLSFRHGQVALVCYHKLRYSTGTFLTGNREQGSVV